MILHLALFMLVAFTGFSSGVNRDCGPLCDYVWAPDDHYHYDLVETQRGEGVTFYTLNMTSQKWYDGMYR